MKPFPVGAVIGGICGTAGMVEAGLPWWMIPVGVVTGGVLFVYLAEKNREPRSTHSPPGSSAGSTLFPSVGWRRPTEEEYTNQVHQQEREAQAERDRRAENQ